MKNENETLTQDKKERKEERREITHGRTEIGKRIKNGTYVELLKKESGIMDEKEFISDKEFLKDIIKDIERNRIDKLVYTKEFRDFELEEWRIKRDRKLALRRLSEKLEEKKDKTGE